LEIFSFQLLFIQFNETITFLGFQKIVKLKNMIKRTIFFSKPYRLSLNMGQLVAQSIKTGEEQRIPVEDIGFLIIENHQVSITVPLIEMLINNNSAVVFCDSKHHPHSMLLNMEGNNLHSEVFRSQIAVSEPLRKNLWKQTVEAKISNQMSLLKILKKEFNGFKSYLNSVKSGDITNMEGAAARLYWPRLFGGDFLRDRYGFSPNNLLNYGYIVLRAAVARALVGSGLMPSLGIFHHNRYNAFCLADDIMEPYRPYVDQIVYDLWLKYGNNLELSKEIKGELLQLLTADVHFPKYTRPLMIALSITTASLARCYGSESKKINYPLMPT